MNPELTLMYVHGTTLGYGRLGVKLAAALDKRGVDVIDDLGSPPDEMIAGDPPRRSEGDYRRRTNVVCWVSTPTHARWWYEGQYPCMFTMWEATVLPESFRETMYEFEQIIVPSQHNVELFSRYHHNVSYVPLGVDPAEWHYVPRLSPDRWFRFMVGGSGKRKGTDLAWKAFQTVFPDPETMTPSPVLVMKNPKGEQQYYGRPGVEMVTGRITDQAEQDLYQSIHCYLQPSRGEGFGLQPLQAIAQGIPTILTNAHGHTAFADLGIPIDAHMTKAEYFIYGDAGDWWEPDCDQLCEAMWDVYKNYTDHAGAAAFAADQVAEKWTWDHTARVFENVLGDAIATPYKGDGSYRIPKIKRYLVRVLRPWTADIAGILYQFQPGLDYYEPADVKRILFEGAILDPSCLDRFALSPDTGEPFELGLTEGQLEKVDHYRAENAYCPTCSQRLNTVTTKVDDILSGLLP